MSSWLTLYLCFIDDDMKSEYDEDEGVQTLAKGKESSKKKRKKRHVKKDQKKRDADEGSACCDTKTKCVIFWEHSSNLAY